MQQRFEEPSAESRPMVGKVLLSVAQRLHVSGALDISNQEVSAPYGYIACPPEETVVLMQETGERKFVILGCLQSSQDLLPGEILIQAQSGASIRLCADGSVNINGTIIGTDGRIHINGMIIGTVSNP